MSLLKESKSRREVLILGGLAAAVVLLKKSCKEEELPPYLDFTLDNDKVITSYDLGEQAKKAGLNRMFIHASRTNNKIYTFFELPESLTIEFSSNRQNEQIFKGDFIPFDKEFNTQKAAVALEEQASPPSTAPEEYAQALILFRQFTNRFGIIITNHVPPANSDLMYAIKFKDDYVINGIKPGTVIINAKFRYAPPPTTPTPTKAA